MSTRSIAVEEDRRYYVIPPSDEQPMIVYLDAVLEYVRHEECGLPNWVCEAAVTFITMHREYVEKWHPRIEDIHNLALTEGRMTAEGREFRRFYPRLMDAYEVFRRAGWEYPLEGFTHTDATIPIYCEHRTAAIV